MDLDPDLAAQQALLPAASAACGLPGLRTGRWLSSKGGHGQEAWCPFCVAGDPQAAAPANQRRWSGILGPWVVAEGFGSGGSHLGGVGGAWGSGCGRLRRDVGGDLNVRFLLF